MESLIKNSTVKSKPVIHRFFQYVRRLATPIFFFAFLLLTANNILAGHIRTCCTRTTAAAKWALAYRSLQRSMESAVASRERRQGDRIKEQRPVVRAVSKIYMLVVSYSRSSCQKIRYCCDYLPVIKKMLRNKDAGANHAAEQKIYFGPPGFVDQ